MPSGNLATVTSYMRKNTISVSAAAVWRNRRGRRTITINDGFPFCVVEREGDGNGPLKEESVQSVVHIKAPRGPQMKEGRKAERKKERSGATAGAKKYRTPTPSVPLPLSRTERERERERERRAERACVTGE